MTQLERKQRRRKIASWVRNRGPTAESVQSAVVEFGANERFVRACCGEFGVRLPDRRKRKSSSPTVVKIVAILTNTTDSLSKIGRKLRVSRQYVSRIYLQCLDKGIPVPARRKSSTKP